MAIYPKARVRLLPESATQPRITPTQVIAHTAVDGRNTASLFPFFSTSSNLESHFYVTASGLVEQYMDTEVRADANNKANARAVSIETHDGWASMGTAGPVTTPWTSEQVAALVELIRWLCDTHDIPPVIAPAWDAPGIGWHNLYPQWSPGATGCPGPTRASQMRDEIIPAVAVKLPADAPAPSPHPSEEDDDMAIIFVRGQNRPEVYRCTAGLGDPILMRSGEQLQDVNALALANGVGVIGTPGRDGFEGWAGSTIPVRVVSDRLADELAQAAR